MSSISFKNLMYKMCLEIIFDTYIYINDLALNNLPNQPIYSKPYKKRENLNR